MANTNFFSIGELSSICNVNSKTLRYYDDIDLVKPEYKSPDTGYRYYTKQQAFKVYLVKKLQTLGFALCEVKDLLESNDYEVYEEKINAKISELDEKIAELEKSKKESALLLDKLAQQTAFIDVATPSADALNLTMSLDEIRAGKVKIEQISAQTFLSTVRCMKLYNNFEISIDRWFEVFKTAESLGLPVSGNVHLMYHTGSPMDQFYMPECNLEVMLPIVDDAASIAPDSNYSLHSLDCFNAAVTYHYGPYETIIHSHLRMMRWLEMNNYEVSAPTMEEYLISPFDLKVDSNYLTKLIYPIRVKVGAQE